MLSKVLIIHGVECHCCHHADKCRDSWAILHSDQANEFAWWHSTWHRFNSFSSSIFKIHNQEYNSASFCPSGLHFLFFHTFIIYALTSCHWKSGVDYSMHSRKPYSRSTPAPFSDVKMLLVLKPILWLSKTYLHGKYICNRND